MKFFAKLIAVIEIIGALLTAYLAWPFVVDLFSGGGSSQRIGDDMVVLPGLVFFVVLGLVAAVLLWKNRTMGYVLSLLLQLLQAISFTTASLSYRYDAFINLDYTVSSEGVVIDWGFLTADFTFILRGGDAAAVVNSFGVDLVAIVLAVILLVGLCRRACCCGRA